MKKKGLRLIVGFTLAAVLAVGIPLFTSCTAPATEPEPTPTPEPTPEEPTPTPTPEEPGAEETVYNLKMITVFPGGESAEESAGQFARDVEAASNGRVKIEWFVPGEIVPEAESVLAVKTGTVDLCQWPFCMGGPLDGGSDFCLIEGGIPFGWLNPFECMTIFDWRGMFELAQDAHHEFGTHLIAIELDDPQVPIATEPITGADWFEGKKISALPTMAPIYEELGASPITLAFEEFYLSLQTGVVDAVHWSGPLDQWALGTYEVAPYMVATSFVNPVIEDIFANKDTWDSLPPDIQEIITLAARETSLRHHTRVYVRTMEVVENWEVNYYSDEDFARIQDIAMAQWDDMAATSPRAAAAIDILRSFREEVNTTGWKGALK